MKTSTSKINVKDDEDRSNEDYLNDEDMSLFVCYYNKYINKNGLKHSEKNLVKFRKSNLTKKCEETRRMKERQHSLSVVNLLTIESIIQSY